MLEKKIAGKSSVSRISSPSPQTDLRRIGDVARVSGVEGRRAPVTHICDVAGVEDRIYFFSSRRRHTRLQGDWSSDVCSSDLIALSALPSAHAASRPAS